MTPTIRLKGLLLAALISVVSFTSVIAQVQTPRNISMIPNSGGFYEYLPQGYGTGNQTYPLIIFLHGSGELGDGSPAQLPRVLANGTPKQINQGIFPTSFTVNGQTSSFIVISPQFFNWPTPLDVNNIINYATQHYRVDVTRIYVTGLSMGGGVVWDYAGNNSLYANRIAAIVPVCGASWPENGRARTMAAANLPIWATHNSGDPTVPVTYTNDYVTQINAVPSPTPLAKKTIFTSSSHDAWTATYNLSFKENNMNVYEWMLQYSRNNGGINQPPVADAGTDVNITLPNNSTQLNAVNSWDADGSIVSYNWSKISGPSQFTFDNANIVNPVLSNLVAGIYTFRLTITDNQGATATDDILVNENSLPVIPGKIEAENYAAMSGIQTEPVSDAGGGLDVGYIEPGDWMDYTPIVATTGNYTVNFRVAAPSAGSQFQLRKSDGTILTTLTIPQTGAYQNWTTITASAPVALTAGQQTLRIYSLSAGWNINWFEFVSNGPVNQPPVANAGQNQNIILPASTVTLTGSGSDPDGLISTYAWSLISGPNTPTISSPNSPATGITGLIEGTYTFRLTVTDNGGATGTADVTVTVSSNTPSQPAYFRTITVDHTKVANTSQLNFPVLVSGTFPYLKTAANGGKVKNANGYDIQFTSDSTGISRLNWEIEKYDGSTGELIAWVKTDLSPTTDKVFYLQYGDSTITSFKGNTSGTWNSSFASVHHLKDGSVLSAADATTNSNNGTSIGATPTNGQIDGAASLNGSSQYINIGNGSSLGITGDLTIEAWINPTDFGNFNGIVGKTAGNQPKPYDFYLIQGSGLPQFFRGNGAGSYSNITGAAAPATGAWSHIVVTTTGNTVKHYLNGNLNGSGTLSASSTGANGTDNVLIGTRSDLVTKFKGKIDEVRISNKALTADWIKTEYFNQSSPATFYAISAEKTVGPPANQPPVVNAGPAQTIILPASSVTLTGTGTDPEGGRVSLAWTLVNGPAAPAPTITSPTAASTTVTGLVQGVYVFRLTATDSVLATGTSDVTITVNPIPGATPKFYYRPLVIDHTKVFNTDQLNFPVEISGTYAFLKTTANGGKVRNANGNDILFTTDSSGTTKLNWEIEKYDGSTGELIAWVKTDLSPVTDKIIYLQYGDSTIISFQGNTTGTWNSSFASVHHLKDGTTLNATDATANANNGINNGATAGTGQIGGAASLNGSNQYINIGNGSSLGITGDITIEAWINPSDFSNFNGIVGKTSGNQPKPYDFYLVQGSGQPQFFRGNGSGANSNVTGSAAPAAGTWSHIVVTASGTTVRHYLNGNLNGTGTLSSSFTPANGTENVLIGTRSDLVTKFKGKMDEVRISNKALSADWIKTEYFNQSSPATFYILGSESSVFSKAKANTAGIPDIQPNVDGKLTGVSIYPNPVTDNFTLQLNNEYARKVNVQLIDANGKIRRQLEFTKTAGLMQTMVNATGLPTGVYFVKLFAGEWSNVIKVVKK